jgi:hypothetical protein
MRSYKLISLVLMFLFAATGIIFLSVPDRVLTLFNNLSSSFGLPESPIISWNFYLILATGYMYLVTVLAFLMFKHPDNSNFPLVLVHAKVASSLISLALFLLQAHYLIYLANFIIDGVIGLMVLTIYIRLRRRGWVYS